VGLGIDHPSADGQDGGGGGLDGRICGSMTAVK
jgi:hypothetical protein